MACECLEARRPCTVGVTLVADHRENIQYKLCLLVHKMFVGHAPDYIASLLTPASDIPSRSSLRSSSNCDLVRWSYTKNESEDWWQGLNFSVAASRAWNRLPIDLKLWLSTASFKNKLKSFSVSCCLHREHCVNSGMRHWSDCIGAQATVVTVTVMLIACGWRSVPINVTVVFVVFRQCDWSGIVPSRLNWLDVQSVATQSDCGRTAPVGLGRGRWTATGAQ